MDEAGTARPEPAGRDGPRQERSPPSTRSPAARDTAALLAKAQEAGQLYTLATGVPCSVLDNHGTCISEALRPEDLPSCRVCPLFSLVPGEDCLGIHLHGARQAQRYGGTFIYLCSLGLMHWASPLLSGGQLAGVMIGGPVLSIEREDAVDSILRAKGAALTRAEAEAHVDRLPRADGERVHALSQMLMTLAEQLSRGAKEEFEGPKRRAEQQSRLSEQIQHIKIRQSAGENTSAYPLETEQLLLAALRRGDHETGRKILNELLGLIFFSNTDRFESMRFRAVELMVLLSRAAMEAGNADEDLLGINNRYLKRIQEASDIEDLTDILHIIVDRLSRRIFSFQGIKHAAALRRAERYIRDHYTQKIALPDVAHASGLSPAYFSSIFKQEMGVGFSDYIAQIRVEKAGRLLVGSSLDLTEITGLCGFEDQSWFSKTFKRFMGVSPGKYRERGGGIVSDSEEIHDV